MLRSIRKYPTRESSPTITRGSGHSESMSRSEPWVVSRRLRYLHAHGWRRRPESQLYNLPTACRGSFNRVVAAVTEAAAGTSKTSSRVAGLLRDAPSIAVS